MYLVLGNEAHANKGTHLHTGTHARAHTLIIHNTFSYLKNKSKTEAIYLFIYTNSGKLITMNFHYQLK